MLVAEGKFSWSVFTAIKNALGAEEGWVTLWGKKLPGCIRKWNSNKRSHLMKGTHILGTARSRTKETQMNQMLHIWTKAALWQHQISQCSVWPLAHRGTGPISDQHEKSSYAKQLNWASEFNYSVQQYFPVCVCVLRSSLESYSSRSDPAWLITIITFSEND